MSAYSKGPWFILTIPNSFGADKSFLAAATYEGHPYHGRTRFFDILGDEDYPTKEADQKLVACAPEMAEMLLRISNLQQGDPVPYSEIIDLCVKAGIE